MKVRAILFLVLTALCTGVVFLPTLVSGKSISRFSMIQQLDVLFNPSLAASGISVPQDPSACLQSIPKGFFVHRSLSEGQSVLWNPQSGCGQPLIADPANTIWNPIDLLFAPSNQDIYSWGLLIKIVLGGVFAYLYFLKNGAVPWAASTAAIGFALSARVLSSVELATNFEMLPALFLAFSYFRCDDSYRRMAAIAVLVALSYFSLHPEVFFIGVTSSSILWLLEGAEGSFAQRSLALLKLGILAIILVSPFLFSFLEYLHYAHSYKFSDLSIQYVPLYQLVSFFLNPEQAETLFPGIVMLLGTFTGLLLCLRTRPYSILVWVLLIAFASRPFPLHEVFGKPPFSFLLPEYALGASFLLFCLFCAIGLSEMQSSRMNVAKRVLLWLPGLIFTILGLLWAWKYSDSAAISSKLFWTLLILLFASSSLIIFASRKRKPVNYRIVNPELSALALFAIPLLNLFTMLAPARATLPATTIVGLPPASSSDLIYRLSALKGERVAACGEGLLVPYTNLLFGISDFRTCSPLNESRYLKFTEKMGGRLGYCNMIELPQDLNVFADIAGLKYLLSREPLHSVTKKLRLPPGIGQEKRAAECRIFPGLRLLSATNLYLPEVAEIDVSLVFRIHSNLGSRYGARLLLLDSQGKTLWSDKLVQLSAGLAAPNKHELVLTRAMPVPASMGHAGVRVVLKVIDTWTGAEQFPDGNGSEKRPEMPLASFNIAEKQKLKSRDHRFSLIYETSDLVRLYKNENALPRAFFCPRVVSADNPEDCLQKLSAEDFDPWKAVVLESCPKTIAGSKQRFDPGTTRTVAEKNTELKYVCDNKEEGVFVLNDLFYPGWRCSVDGAEARIYRANYLFRAILLAPGRHELIFRYVPLPFLAGLILQAAALCSFFAISLFSQNRHNRSAPS